MKATWTRDYPSRTPHLKTCFDLCWSSSVQCRCWRQASSTNEFISAWVAPDSWQESTPLGGRLSQLFCLMCLLATSPYTKTWYVVHLFCLARFILGDLLFHPAPLANTVMCFSFVLKCCQPNFSVCLVAVVRLWNAWIHTPTWPLRWLADRLPAIVRPALLPSGPHLSCRHQLRDWAHGWTICDTACSQFRGRVWAGGTSVNSQRFLLFVSSCEHFGCFRQKGETAYLRGHCKSSQKPSETNKNSSTWNPLPPSKWTEQNFALQASTPKSMCIQNTIWTLKRVFFESPPPLPNEFCSFQWASANFCDGPLSILIFCVFCADALNFLGF